MDVKGDKAQGGRMTAQIEGWRPAWSCLVPVAALWLVVQEESPLHPYLGLAEVGGRVLLAAGLCLAVGLWILALRFSNSSGKPHEYQSPYDLQGEILPSTHNHIVMATKSAKNTQRGMPGWGAAGHAVPAVQALTDCLVLSLLHEPQHTYATFSMLPLISRLERLSKAIQTADILWDPLLQEKHEQEEDKEDAIRDRIKDIKIYLEGRTEALHCLQRLQTEYEACVRDTRAQLQKQWLQLEELHIRVTLSPKQTSGPPDPNLVLRDIQCLCSELDHSKSRVHQCQTYLAANSKILKELDHSWLELSKTMHSDVLHSSWTSDLLQANNDEFNEALLSLTSLEQQTSTFVAHLNGLEKAIRLDNKQTANSHSLTTGSQHVNGSVKDPSLESEITDEKSAKHLFRMKSGSLCGLRKRRR